MLCHLHELHSQAIQKSGQHEFSSRKAQVSMKYSIVLMYVDGSTGQSVKSYSLYDIVYNGQ